LLVQVKELMRQLRDSRADPALALLESSIKDLDDEFVARQREFVDARSQLKAAQATAAHLSATVARMDRTAAAQRRYGTIVLFQVSPINSSSNY
jgi:archaellum biogenesis ATPase FlaH